VFICQPGGVGDVVDMSVTTNDGGQIEPILGQDSFSMCGRVSTPASMTMAG